MKNNNGKCSMDDHKEIDAIYYCQTCNIFMCENCNIYHEKLLKNHHQIIIDKNTDRNEIFTGFCKENNHSSELKYYCKTHNLLCCVKCICKIKDK